ncbi:Ig-like domain repeat protein [Treponema sp. HNW]|uniref:Ig-like domain repeat protein n=1 Tax=Treponema sp. HNW TaxID=3116654 RepID=UPI003D14FBB1
MKTHKPIRNTLVSIAAAFVGIIMYSACEQYVGLGSGIDILPPKGQITYPDAGETPIRGSFVIKGTAKDDEGIVSIDAVFENDETKVRSRSFSAKPFAQTAETIQWEIEVNNEPLGEEPGHPLVKLYPIADGQYTVIITLTDKNGKTVTLNRTYKIDNTPPVFIVERPSLSATYDASAPVADQYGAVMKIVGSAADMHELSSIRLEADRLATPITKKNKENSVNIVMASSSEPTYNDLVTAAGGNDKPLKSTITLQDNARMYNGSADGTGNESAFYYVKNEIEGSIDLNKYTAKVISDYFSGKKGKDGGTPHEQAVFDLRHTDTQARTILSDKRIIPLQKKSVFSLNPDKSPGFKVIGAYAVIFPEGSTAPTPSPASMLFGSSSSLTVELYPNRDGTALVSGTDYAASGIKIKLCKGNTVADLKNGTYTAEKTFFDATASSPDFSGVTQSGGLIKITKPLPPDIEPGFYRMNVEGRDVNNNGFVAYNDENKPSGGLLIVEFKAAGAPYIFPHQPNPYQKGNFTVSCTVENLAGGSVYYKLDNPAGEDVPAAAFVFDPKPGTTNVYEKLINTSSLTQEGDHVVHLRARVSNALYATSQVPFVLDKTPPEAAGLISDHVPANGTFSNWSHTFKGTAKDKPINGYPNGSGIERVIYKVGGKTGNTITYGDEIPAKLTPSSGSAPSYDWEAVVSFGQKMYNYVHVSVYDKAGNKTDKQFGPYEVNTDSPQIKFDDVRFSLGSTYVEASPVTLVKQNAVIGNGTSNESKKASFKIFAKNAFGIKTVKVSIGNGAEKDGIETGSSADYEEWTVQDVVLTEGNPNFKLYVESKSGTVTEWQTPVIVDFSAPTVRQTSPDLQNVFFKEIKLMGSIVDEAASGLSSGADPGTVTYQIGNSGFVTSHIAGGSELSKIEYTGGAWTITIPDIAKYQTGFGAALPSGSIGVYSIPVHIRVSDKAGNGVTSTEFRIKFDPAGGAPFAELNTPKADDALGGEILISGSAHVANPASGKSVKEIYLQLGQTQAQLEADTSWTLGGTDYGAAGGVKIYPASGNADVYYWNYILPDAVKAAILGSAQSKEVFLRVKAKNNDGLLGDWTPARKFTINTDVARFTGMKLVKSDGTSEDYSPNSVWLKGDAFKIKGAVSHSAGIKDTIKAESPSQLPLGYESLFTSGSSGWFTAQSSVPPGGFPGYTFEIPVKTFHYTKRAGNIQFNISAVDARTDGTPVPVTYPIILKYDNSQPSVAAGEYIVKSASALFSAGSFTADHLENDAEHLDNNKKDLYRVLVNNQVYTIQTISGTDVTLSNASSLNGTFDYGIVERPKMIFDGDGGSDYQITGIASDTGSGVQKVTAKLEIVKGTVLETVSVDMTRSDGSNKISRERGDMVSFKGSLNTEGVSNGKGRLTITAYDENDNAMSEQITDIIVKNKPIAIKKIVFKTDLSGNGAYESNEEFEVTDTGNFNSDRDFTVTVTAASSFTFKNPVKSELAVTLKGGYGTQAVVSLHKEGTPSGTIGDEIMSASGTITGAEYTVNLDLNGKLNIGDADEKKLFLKVADESIGTVPPASSVAPSVNPYWHAQADISVGLDVEDDIAPKGFIMPLFYNSNEGRITRPEDLPLVSVVYDTEEDTQTGVIKVKEPLGHIELASISDLGNNHPSVSGKVMLRGIAYDNIRLKTLTLSGAGIAAVSNEFTNGAWSPSSALKVVKNGLSNTGHYVEWEYEWTTDTPAKAKTITLTVTDAKASPNSSTASTVSEPVQQQGSRPGDRALILDTGETAVKHQFIRLYEGDKSYLVQVKNVSSTQEGSQFKTMVTWDTVSVPLSITHYKLYTDTSHKPSLTVNIVPYVIKMETALSKLGGINDPDLYARTALGRYPVQDKEKIKIHGFNLTGAAATVGGVSSGTLSGTSSPWELTLASNVKSGKLDFTVGASPNQVKAVNNGNNNDKPYNKVPKTANNDKLTDDLWLDVWQFNDKAARPHRGVITEPVMHINPSNGMIGFAFANGPDFFSMSNGTGNSYERWQRNYDDYGNVDFIYDSEGNSHGVVVGRDINSGGNQGGKFTYFSSKWGISSITNQAANYDDTKGRRLEAIGQIGDMNGAGGTILDKTRIQHPSLAAVIASDAGKPRIYLAYYDGINDQIRFKYGTNDKAAAADFGQFKDQETTRAVTPYNQNNVGIVAGKYKNGSAVVDTGNVTGTYLSLGVVSGAHAASDTAVLIWFDETNRMLKYTYKTDPQNGSHASQSGDGNGTWSIPIDVFDKMNVGEYCKIAVDKAGGIHIAAFDSDTADLKYAYLSSYSDTAFKRSTVDSYGITGTHITLDVAYTAAGTAGKPVPYIGYYSASAGRSKLAYLVDTATGVSGSAQGTDDTGYFTGKWEVSVVPTASRVQQDNINVGIWKTSGGVIKDSTTGVSDSNISDGKIYGNGTANPVLAYAIRQAMNGYIETAQKK